MLKVFGISAMLGSNTYLALLWNLGTRSYLDPNLDANSPAAVHEKSLDRIRLGLSCTGLFLLNLSAISVAAYELLWAGQWLYMWPYL